MTGKRKFNNAAVDLVDRLNSSSSPSSSDKKKFAELSANDMEAVILHVNLDWILQNNSSSKFQIIRSTRYEPYLN